MPIVALVRELMNKPGVARMSISTRGMALDLVGSQPQRAEP
jgi:hypothetical protein